MGGYYSDDINSVLGSLRTDKEHGIRIEESRARLVRYGPNKIKEAKKVPYIFKFFEQFTDLLALILVTASVLSLLMGSYKDALVIFLIVLFNAAIGFFQEFKAEKAIEALKKYMAEKTTVVRGNDTTVINSAELVPGDIVVLTEGERVPADLRLTQSLELSTNDAAITGESDAQSKSVMETEEPKGQIGDLVGTVLMGTTVIHGEGRGVVIATGMDTEFGKIAKVTTEQKANRSPLQIETDRLAKTIAKISGAIVLVLVTIFSVLQGHFDIRESFEFAIGVASALVPEGLPATVSIALAIGVQRMAQRKAAIRRLSAVETLGDANVIVTDKTGTLTKNQMTVKEIFFSGNLYHVKGVGYQLDGEITENGKMITHDEKKGLEPLFLPAIYANDAEVDTKNHARPEFVGDSTELALLVAAEKAGFDAYKMQHSAVVTQEIPFEAERKFMGKMIKVEDKEIAYFKGAPTVILSMCERIYKNGKIEKLTEKDKHDILFYNDQFSQDALRVMAVAYKERDNRILESGLIFGGLFGIIDPPREEVAETIRLARDAGIRAVMVTGDYGVTAAAVAKRIRMNENPKIYTGDDLNNMSDHELIEVLKQDDIIFSRVDPIHKLRIVTLFQKMGKIVAVTGDGVNDAPALKKSDIGVAMGITGTDVSKEAAEMVSLNDSFSSIVWAVKEGRVVYENIKKATKVIITNNTAEFTAVALGLILGIPPIFAIQILLIDLGSEVFPSLALAADPFEDDVMNRPPRDGSDRLINKESLGFFVRNGFTAGFLGVLGFCIFGYLHGWHIGDKFTDQNLYYTATAITYTVVSLCVLVTSFSVRSKTKYIHQTIRGNKYLAVASAASFAFICALMYIPFFQNIANMRPLPILWWGIAILLTFVYMIFIETTKFIQNKLN